MHAVVRADCASVMSDVSRLVRRMESEESDFSVGGLAGFCNRLVSKERSLSGYNVPRLRCVVGSMPVDRCMLTSFLTFLSHGILKGPFYWRRPRVYTRRVNEPSTEKNRSRNHLPAYPVQGELQAADGWVSVRVEMKCLACLPRRLPDLGGVL